MTTDRRYLSMTLYGSYSNFTKIFYLGKENNESCIAGLAQWRLRLICNEELPGVRVPYPAPLRGIVRWLAFEAHNLTDAVCDSRPRYQFYVFSQNTLVEVTTERSSLVNTERHVNCKILFMEYHSSHRLEVFLRQF